MDRTSTLYIIWMCLGGLGLALLGAQFPGVRGGVVPAPMWLLLISFLFDGAVMVLGPRLGLSPLNMGVRFAGVLAGALLYMLVDSTLVAAPPQPKT